MADRGWKRLFDDPVPLPRGRLLVTLKHTAHYIMKLLKTDWIGEDLARSFQIKRSPHGQP
jgi:hypothetical protein